MKQETFLILLLIIKLVVLENPQPIELKYKILLTLKKFDIEPTRGLCKQIGMKKSQGACVQNNDGFLKLRRQNGQYSQKTLCGILKLPYCEGTCCLSGGVCKNSAIVINDDTKGSENLNKFQGSKDEPLLQSQCNQSGMIWCAGECCGFSSKYHKCFRTNHYGVPYERCPIQASEQ